MIVRHHQLLQLSEHHANQFESDVIKLVREEFPERCSHLADRDLRMNVRQIAERAHHAYGIGAENAATKFIYLCWLLGDDFDTLRQHSWIRDILRHPRPDCERMEIIMSGVIHHLRAKDGTLRVIEDSHVDS